MYLIFSVANNPYHKYLNCLYNSVKKHFSEAKFVAVLVDMEECDYPYETIHLNTPSNIKSNIYCAGLRTKMFNELSKKYPEYKLIYIDADSFFVNDTSDFKEHIDSCSISMRPKDLNKGTFASGVITFNPNLKHGNFFEKYEQNYVDHVTRTNEWMSDQLMLNKTYNELKNEIDFKPLEKKYCDVWFSDEGVLWTAKGKTRNEYKFIDKMKEYQNN